MRSKAPLSLMEQMIMLLVFALAAALCLQAFVKSDAVSRRDEARAQAVVRVQTAAEVLSSTGGDFSRAAGVLGGTCGSEDSLGMFFDEEYRQVPSMYDMALPNGAWVRSAPYVLLAKRIDSGVPGLGKAEINVYDNINAEELFRIETAWQEVLP